MASLDIRMFQEKCSICFDTRLDFCLEECQDQFCRPCFNRYVSEVVRSAWGLSTPKIKCPVCSNPLDKHEWAHYVRDDVIEMYDRNSRPYKSLKRCCPSCSHEVPVVEPSNESKEKREKVFDEVLNRFRTLTQDAQFLEEFQNKLTRHLHSFSGDVSLADIYAEAMSHMKKIATSPPPRVLVSSISKRRRICPPSPVSPGEKEVPSPITSDTKIHRHLLPSHISSLIISTALNSTDYIQLQFEHLHSFSDTLCNSCGTGFCMTCGELGWGHKGGCLDVMKRLVERWTCRLSADINKPSSNDNEYNSNTGFLSSFESLEGEESYQQEILANLRWKVENSKNCPRCYTLIQRDDGCNKVDCAMCGHKFCWICQGDWSEKCGFFRCRIEPLSPDSEEQKTSSPNVSTADGYENNNEAADYKVANIEDSRRSSVVDDKPELGVPDVVVIQARLSRQQSIA